MSVFHKSPVYSELVSHFIIESQGHAVIGNGNTLREAGEVGDLLGYSREERAVKVEVAMLYLKMGNKMARRC